MPISLFLALALACPAPARAGTAAEPLGAMRQPMQTFLASWGSQLGASFAFLDLDNPEHQSLLAPAARLLPENFAQEIPARQYELFTQAVKEVGREAQEELDVQMKLIVSDPSEAREEAGRAAERLMRLRAERYPYLRKDAIAVLDQLVELEAGRLGEARMARMQKLLRLAKQGRAAELDAALAAGPEDAVYTAPAGALRHADLAPAPRGISSFRYAHSQELAMRALARLRGFDPDAVATLRDTGALPHLPDIAGRLLNDRTRITSDDGAVREMLNYMDADPEVVAPVTRALRSILAFAARAGIDPSAWDFVSSVMRLYQRRLHLDPPAWAPYQPLAPPISGDVWDLGSLAQPEDSLPALDPSHRYFFFDLSRAMNERVAEEIELMREEGLPTAHLRVVHADILTLKKPRRPLALIHLKNMFHYVPELREGRLLEMADWLGEGGHLVLRAEPRPTDRRWFLEDLDPIARALLHRGWTLSFRQGDWRDFSDRVWDEIVFTKPPPGAPPTPARAWQDVVWQITPKGP